MKKVLLSLALSLLLSAPAFAASADKTDIGSWSQQHTTADYAGTQRTTAAAGKSANGIVFSRHNLSSYGEHYQSTLSTSGTRTKYAGIAGLGVTTTEICVFCHTPHFGKTTTAPLWNRGSSASTYVAYGSTLGGTGISTFSTSANSSLACLSCHDGVTTIDNLVNKPGKSGISANGTDAGWAFSEVGDLIGDTTAGGSDAYAVLKAGKDASRLNIGDGGYQAGDAGRNSAAVSLANDHPIDVYYNANSTNTSSVTITTGNVGKASLRPTDTVIYSITMDNARAADSDISTHGSTSVSGWFGRSDNLWAAKGAISSTVTIADMLRDGGKVQCASCHDPHYKNQTNTDPAIVCSYFPKKSDRNGTHAIYGTYADEATTPTTEGCWTASTNGTVVATTGLVWGTVAANEDTFLNHYMTEKDSDGLFLRRVGGNSNSGVCRTCHNK